MGTDRISLGDNLEINNHATEDQVVLGQQEAVKEAVKQSELNKEKIQTLSKFSDKILFCFQTHKLFEIFPLKITIDPTKVNIIKKDLLTENIHSIFIADIKDILMTSTLLSASLQILNNAQGDSALIQIKNLKKADALKAKRLIQGLIVAKKEEIKLAQFSSFEEFIDKVEQLGDVKS